MTTHDITQKIRDAIHSGSVHMRPRWYFTAGAVLLGIGLAASVIVAILSIALSVYRFRVAAPFTLLHHGGFTPFVQTTPWAPLCVALVGIVAGILLIRRFPFGYRRALPGLLLGFLGTLVVVGAIADTAGVPRRVADIGFIGPFFEQDLRGDQWVIGLLDSVDDETLSLTAPYGETFTIVVQRETLVQPDTPLMPGEWLRVIGDFVHNQYRADVILHGPLPHNAPGGFLPINGTCVGPFCGERTFQLPM